MKKILIFWGRLSKGSNPIAFGSKQDTYIQLMNKLELLDAEVYLCRGFENYLGNNHFRVNFIYKNQKLLPLERVISPDGVYDRSTGISFPELGARNVLNNLDFKKLVNNKWLSYLSFPQYFPETHQVKDIEEVDVILKKYSKDDTLVVKPYDGLKGQLVEFFKVQNSESIKELLLNNPQKTFILQKFIDTSHGFQDIKGVHDLRVVIVNNKIVWSHIRTPASGKLKANVAEGGFIKELDIHKLPIEVVNIVNIIKGKFYKSYNNPIYSIDFGISKGKAFIFEFNDTIGFPTPEMRGKYAFINELASRLIAFD